MYSNDERTQVRKRLVDRAQADRRFSGVALCGSAAVGREDTWSDIDLAFGVDSAADLSATVADWTADMYHVFGSLHHVETTTGSKVYRAFLLPSTLQVDLNFVPADDFGARGPRFRLLSGLAGEPPPASAPAPDHFAGIAGSLQSRRARVSAAGGSGRLNGWLRRYANRPLRWPACATGCLRLEALASTDSLSPSWRRTPTA
jgi:predicted nucleotidyltransferase